MLSAAWPWLLTTFLIFCALLALTSREDNKND